MADSAGAAPPEPGPTLGERLAGDLEALEKELGEIDLLVAQATAEAGRHEARRVAAADKASRAAGEGTEPAQLNALYEQLMTLTKRAALMESQVEVLEGKRRALTRYRDALAGYVEGAKGGVFGAASGGGGDGTVDVAETLEGIPPAVSRLLMTAQEDMRREIARAMHDGPAQSLTNIVLQAQIVERLVGVDPASAHGEVRQLVGMVQQTLEATKSFIFDVRPMVLDDLGLVPTLRRAARDRGRRAGVAVEFDSLGADRRLSMDLESGLFRILDEALTAFLSLGPDRLAVTLDWGDQLEARVTASRGAATDEPAGEGAAEARPPERKPDRKGKKEAELPPALAAMIEDRRADERDAAEAARVDALIVLPPSAWREIESRARTLGIQAELLGDGSEVRVLVEHLGPEPPPPA
jgi:two-component system sensor histidine kinase DegS